MAQTFTIDADNPLADALRSRARVQGKTVGEIVREILARALLEEPSKRQDDLPTAGQATQTPLNRREREHAWRRSHRDLLQERYAGEWAVLEGEEILAHGKDAVTAVEEAKAKRVAVPYVFFVQPPREPGVVRIGL